LKESNPVEVEEYVTACGIKDEPAFAWWVPYTLRKSDRIIAAVTNQLRKSSHKYGIEIPTSIDHAKEIDERKKKTLWQDALKLEISNVGLPSRI